MRVLIATDGSDFSKNAVEKFCDLFEVDSTTQFKLISVVEHIRPMVAEPFGASNEHFRSVEEDLRKAALVSVEGYKEYIKTKFPDLNLDIKTEVSIGNVKKIIVDDAEQFEADIVVVGSHGYGFVGRMLLGSVSDYVIHHAPCSVIVIRSEAE